MSGVDRDHHLLSVDEMYAVDAAAIASGVPGIQLMESAGRAVADDIRIHYTPRSTVVLCGPGNNGGDGFVVARLLEAAGWPVQVALLGDRAKLAGDAALDNAKKDHQVLDLAAEVLVDADLVIDAVFGAGLTRAVDGIARQTLEAVAASGARVVAIDIPSGVDGNTGAALGYAVQADRCVTFFRKKSGHCLLPGRALCGVLRVADIGITDRVIESIRPMTWENHPDLWKDAMRWPASESHKYTRGFAVVVSGGAETTGAPRLAARAALRA
ncbi:MAG: NAD(P)H-hydrate epimerase, partial [Proteobacteria bacterium]|nr:NAD(P)H-hydrate epimerase [Pseudomonadota bacterium]